MPERTRTTLRGAEAEPSTASERLIVAVLDPQGTVDTSHGLHLPATSRHSLDGDGRLETLTDRISRNNGIPPYEWTSVCGLGGIVYVQGGGFENLGICPDCEKAAA